MSVAVTKLRFIILNHITKNKFLSFTSIHSSPASENVADITRKFEISREFEDWKYVEKVLPLSLVPLPTKKEVFPSGWRPQKDDLKNQPYFIKRTKNHMMPVYLDISQNGIRKHTKVKYIQGDIWLLEKELREFLQKESIKPLRSQVNELAGFIRFNGDFVNAIKYWLQQKYY